MSDTRSSSPLSVDSLQRKLEKEFCPPLDTSLLAALLVDLPADPSSNLVDSLRETLKQLASQAEEEQLLDEDLLGTDAFPDLDRQLSILSTTDDTSSTNDYFYDYSSGAGSSTSSARDQPFSSPLGFLQAAFPHVPMHRLRRTVLEAEDTGSMDMVAIVETLLTEDYIRELEERGLDGEDGDDADLPWITVKQSVPQHGGTGVSKKKARGKTISVVDIRQQHHVRPAHRSRGTSANGSVDGPVSRGAPDPWTQVSSLSSHLATLLAPHPPTFFSSFFHSPNHHTPASALRAALLAIAQKRGEDINGELSPEMTQCLFAILDVVCASPTYAVLNAEERTQVESDADLALRATNGESASAFDIVWLLRDLDADSASYELDMGVYHTPAPVMASAYSSAAIPAKSSAVRANGHPQLPDGPPDPHLPLYLQPKPIALPARSNGKQRNPYQWQKVPEKLAKKAHPAGAFIPAYNTSPGHRKAKGGGNAFGKGGKGDVGELGFYGNRMNEWRWRRDDALRQATRHWKGGSAKTRGGEVAMYFAERAREFSDRSRMEALDAAREMVMRKRMTSRDKDTIDLHGTTVAEAEVIAKEVLAAQLGQVSAATPLKLITGRGKHSANNVGVLGPAVKRSLEADGWMVSQWDGGLVVRGRTARWS